MIRNRTTVKIGKYLFTQISSFEVIQNKDNYSTVARITMPNTLAQITDEAVGINFSEIKSVINKNDFVGIWSGGSHDGKTTDNFNIRFRGFVTSIKVDSEIEIMAEDAMYAYKQVNIKSKLWQSVTLGTLLNYCLADVNIPIDADPELLKTNLGGFQIENNSTINALQIFDKIKSQFPINFFITYSDAGNPMLKVLSVTDKNILSSQQTDQNGNKVIYSFVREINLRSNNDLKFQSEDDENFVIKGISNRMVEENGKTKSEKITVYVYKYLGEFKVSDLKQNGEQRTLNFVNLNREDLIKTCKQQYESMNYSGMTGTFDAYLDPKIQAGDIIRYQSYKYKEQSGRYRVRSVQPSWNVRDGGKQKIEIDYCIEQNNI